MLARCCESRMPCGRARSAGRTTSQYYATPHRRLILGRTSPACSPGGSGNRIMRRRLRHSGTIGNWSRSSPSAGSTLGMCGRRSVGRRTRARSNLPVEVSWEPSPLISWPLCTGRSASPSVPAVRACTCLPALRAKHSVTFASGAETTGNLCGTPNEIPARARRRGF